MATHDVTIDLPTRFVLHSDVTFVVWSDDAKLGELQVSKGSIDWLPGNGRTRYRMRWEKFNEVMKSEGRANAALKRPPVRQDCASTHPRSVQRPFMSSSFNNSR